MSYWSKLSMKDKADVMRIFLDKGISDLNTMKREYNIFAEGGDTNDNDLVDWIIREEGFNSRPENIGDGKITLGSGLTDKKWHDLYRKRGNKWSAEDNRMAVAEEVANRRRWAEKNIPNWNTLPDSAQKALLSYKYNYNFTSANSPKLFQALRDSNLYEAAKQMDATSKDPKFKKGLMDRRKREQEWFLSDVMGSATPTQAAPVQAPVTINTSMIPLTEPAVSTAVRNNYVPATTTPYNRGNNMRRAFESAVAYNRMMDATSLQNNPLPEYPFPISYANGGKIHINPSKKGTFTAAASRHDMGVQEFASKVLANKENYSPAMVKKANFARNASKWHGFGGNLFDGTTENSQQMTRPNIFQRPDGSYFYSTDGMETDVTPINVLGDNPALWTFTDSSGKIYRPAQALSNNYTLTEAEDANPLERAANNYFRELDWRAKNDPSSIALQGKYTMPLVLSPLLGKGAAVALANPYVDAGLTSYFGAHGLQSLANGEADWTTALEITPLGRLARPLWNAGKEGLQYAVKAADNATRYVSPSYDLYRTIGETPIGKEAVMKSIQDDWGYFAGPHKTKFFDQPYREYKDIVGNKTSGYEVRTVKEPAEVPEQFGFRVSKYGVSDVLGADGKWYSGIREYSGQRFSDPIDKSIIVGKKSYYEPESYLFHYDQGNYPVVQTKNGVALGRIPDGTGEVGPIWWKENSIYGPETVGKRTIRVPRSEKYEVGNAWAENNRGIITTTDYPLEDAEFLQRNDLVGTLEKGRFYSKPNAAAEPAINRVWNTWKR